MAKPKMLTETKMLMQEVKMKLLKRNG